MTRARRTDAYEIDIVRGARQRAKGIVYPQDPVRRVVPCGVKRLDGITDPPERRRAQEAAAAVTWRPKCNHVNTLHAAGATPLRGPGKGTQAHGRRPDKGHEQRTTRENHKVRVGGTNRKRAQERPRAATKCATRKYSGGQHAQVQGTWPQCGFQDAPPPTRPRHTAHHS
jgi:hypothetical protein